MAQNDESTPRVPVHSRQQEDEQLRRFWRRAGGDGRDESRSTDGYAEESDETQPESSWGPI